ncbi:MAG TPA: DUF6174 domain-containing protein [Anaerolineales bacterium]|nr:DUF6174 domain-containing protein [Anaerolineales bacterium]
MSKKALLLVAFVVGLVVIAAAAYALTSGTPAHYLQLRTLDAQEARWQSQGLTHYQMKLSIGCFCPFFDRMPLAVEVRDGQVVSVVDSQGQPVAADDPIRSSGNEPLLTIDGVFAAARDYIRTADEVKIAYDPFLGFPSSMSIDQIKRAMDDELSVTIQDVKALP